MSHMGTFDTSPKRSHVGSPANSRGGSQASPMAVDDLRDSPPKGDSVPSSSLTSGGGPATPAAGGALRRGCIIPDFFRSAPSPFPDPNRPQTPLVLSHGSSRRLSEARHDQKGLAKSAETNGLHWRAPDGQQQDHAPDAMQFEEEEAAQRELTKRPRPVTAFPTSHTGAPGATSHDGGAASNDYYHPGWHQNMENSIDLWNARPSTSGDVPRAWRQHEGLRFGSQHGSAQGLPQQQKHKRLATPIANVGEVVAGDPEFVRPVSSMGVAAMPRPVSGFGHRQGDGLSSFLFGWNSLNAWQGGVRQGWGSRKYLARIEYRGGGGSDATGSRPGIGSSATGGVIRAVVTEPMVRNAVSGRAGAQVYERTGPWHEMLVHRADEHVERWAGVGGGVVEGGAGHSMLRRPPSFSPEMMTKLSKDGLDGDAGSGLRGESTVIVQAGSGAGGGGSSTSEKRRARSSSRTVGTLDSAMRRRTEGGSSASSFESGGEARSASPMKSGRGSASPKKGRTASKEVGGASARTVRSEVRGGAVSPKRRAEEGRRVMCPVASRGAAERGGVSQGGGWREEGGGEEGLGSPSPSVRGRLRSAREVSGERQSSRLKRGESFGGVRSDSGEGMLSGGHSSRGTRRSSDERQPFRGSSPYGLLFGSPTAHPADSPPRALSASMRFDVDGDEGGAQGIRPATSDETAQPAQPMPVRRHEQSQPVGRANVAGGGAGMRKSSTTTDVWVPEDEEKTDIPAGGKSEMRRSSVHEGKDLWVPMEATATRVDNTAELVHSSGQIQTGVYTMQEKLVYANSFLGRQDTQMQPLGANSMVMSLPTFSSVILPFMNQPFLSSINQSINHALNVRILRCPCCHDLSKTNRVSMRPTG